LKVSLWGFRSDLKDKRSLAPGSHAALMKSSTHGGAGLTIVDIFRARRAAFEKKPGFAAVTSRKLWIEYTSRRESKRRAKAMKNVV